MDKLRNLASIIVNYSINVSENEKVLITTQSLETRDFIGYLIDEIYNKKAIPVVKFNDPIIGIKLLEKNTEQRIKVVKKMLENEVEMFDSFIQIRYSTNDYENKNINNDISKKLSKALFKSTNIRVNKRKWVLLNYPSQLDSFKSKMTTREFFDYALDVMTIDYKELEEKIRPLKELMDKTDKVRIVSPNTDLTFSIKKMNSIPCVGKFNLPDGEIYSAPIKNSINGIITFNTPSSYKGNIYNNICLEFKNGKIIKASCSNDSDKLNEILNTDEGSRYIGEFALGLNPKIKIPNGDILYDEKIIGSIHLTPGQAYRDCYNGNDSGIHWDMVLIQRKEYGGGEIYFDDILIRKDGKFVLKELENLNYEN